MKFDYYKEWSVVNSALHHFHYILCEDDVQKVLHKYSYTPEWMRSLFENFEHSPTDHPPPI